MYNIAVVFGNQFHFYGRYDWKEEHERRKNGRSPPDNKGFESESSYPLPEAEHESCI